MTAPEVKPLIWMGTSLDDVRRFPEEVREVIGYALHVAQLGEKHPDAKPLRGFGGAGVLEVVDDFDGNTYRAVYTVKFKGMVFALHAFQKKSTQGKATPKHHMELVKKRLKDAEETYARIEAAKEQAE